MAEGLVVGRRSGRFHRWAPCGYAPPTGIFISQIQATIVQAREELKPIIKRLAVDAANLFLLLCETVQNQLSGFFGRTELKDA